MVIVDKDEVFYDCVKSFTIWETFWFSVTSFSMFVSSLCTLCCKVCKLMQTLVETQLDQSHKKATASYYFTNLNLTQKPNELVCTQNPFLETCLETKCAFVASFPRFHSTCTHFHFLAIDPVNVLATSLNKQTLVSRSSPLSFSNLSELILSLTLFLFAFNVNVSKPICTASSFFLTLSLFQAC